MVKRPNTEKQRQLRHKRVRGKISGTTECPRLSVYRSNLHIYVQLIDDVKQVTLASASSNDKGFSANGGNKEGARAVGKAIGEKAKKLKIKQVVFDRGGYLYHGRVQELAEGAREAGLEF